MCTLCAGRAGKYIAGYWLCHDCFDRILSISRFLIENVLPCSQGSVDNARLRSGRSHESIEVDSQDLPQQPHQCSSTPCRERGPVQSRSTREVDHLSSRITASDSVVTINYFGDGANVNLHQDIATAGPADSLENALDQFRRELREASELNSETKDEILKELDHLAELRMEPIPKKKPLPAAIDFIRKAVSASARLVPLWDAVARLLD